MTFKVEDGTPDAVAVVPRVRTGVACLVEALFFTADDFTADDFFTVGFFAGLFFAAGFFRAVASAVALLLDFAALFSAFAASFFSSDFDFFSLLSGFFATGFFATGFFATAFFVDFSFFATDFFESFCATLAPYTLRGGTRASAPLSRIPVGGRRISFRVGPKWLA